MSYYSHCSFLWLQIFEILVYKEIKIHFLLVTLKKKKKVVLDRFFENLEFVLDDSISHY